MTVLLKCGLRRMGLPACLRTEAFSGQPPRYLLLLTWMYPA